jgi:hypothetical protein
VRYKRKRSWQPLYDTVGGQRVPIYTIMHFVNRNCFCVAGVLLSKRQTLALGGCADDEDDQIGVCVRVDIGDDGHCGRNIQPQASRAASSNG